MNTATTARTSPVIRAEAAATLNVRPLHPLVEKPQMGRIIRHEDVAALSMGAHTLPESTQPGASCWPAPEEAGSEFLETIFSHLSEELGLPFQGTDAHAQLAA